MVEAYNIPPEINLESDELIQSIIVNKTTSGYVATGWGERCSCE